MSNRWTWWLPEPGVGFTPPDRLRRLIEALPTQPPSFVLARALDRWLLPRLPDDVRERLRDQPVELRVSDLGIVARVHLGARGFGVAPAGAVIRVRISATLDTYLRLARGTEDADRLFFERALLMQGDTETALVIKNTLDAIGPLWD
jgi:O2-independent ubiquinone biosynthesis accessory factor UbiT